ncbi:MAG: Glu/Leu/Phe/Val dehydrogenase dimerization domain-containing protein [Alkalilacustris sp.]
MTDRADALAATFLSTLPSDGGDALMSAVETMARDVLTVEKANAAFASASVLARLVVPDRIIAFRVEWRDDAGEVHVNRGWRVQQSNLLGPYKGGLRWSPQTSLPVLRALAFEQIFKNALTGLPLGGAKGGSDFDPSGRSSSEIERFARAFMDGLGPDIGPDRDVPAGDMGVGADTLGLLSRAWSRSAGRWGGALTGKPLCLGGSALRAEATGHGLVYFLDAMLAERDEAIEGKTVAISGRGAVAWHAASRLTDAGARVLSLSGRAGTWYSPEGMTPAALDWVQGAGPRASDPPTGIGLRFLSQTQPWGLGAEIALPCATQDEIDPKAARALVEGGCRFLAEGANMPVTREAAMVLDQAGVIQGPGKAANAGGVVVSALEMQQNAGFARWSTAQVDQRLRRRMRRIHDLLRDEAGANGTARSDQGTIDYRRAANRAAYRRLASAMIDGGVI